MDCIWLIVLIEQSFYYFLQISLVLFGKGFLVVVLYNYYYEYIVGIIKQVVGSVEKQ